MKAESKHTLPAQDPLFSMQGFLKIHLANVEVQGLVTFIQFKISTTGLEFWNSGFLKNIYYF
jgi:hypothetical protein